MFGQFEADAFVSATKFNAITFGISFKMRLQRFRIPQSIFGPSVPQSRFRTRSLEMKALVYNGPRDVQVKNVPDAKIERPTDVLVKITSTNICGSDLHMYEGRTDMEKGRVLGHENLGQVVEVGEAVDRI